ncbi:hypothetical protein NL676_023307 [Syzygium grande]|nr:hypothetical protein NL676_023307 [Syzygium grande]
MTDEVWDFVFCGGPNPQSSDIPSSVLNQMKQEFEYWYPFDLRVSGKDLIQNHLTFCIYNHTAIMSKRHWPRGFRCNGHLMLNSEKMSKSTGNFKTLRQSIEEFSADATRFSLADAGDGVDDANFVSETANAAILRLTKELSWMEEVLDAESSLRMGPPSTYADREFANDMNIAVQLTEQQYQDFMFCEALKTGFFMIFRLLEMNTACRGGTSGMNRDLLWRFMDVQTRLIAPICPHYAEYVWRVLLKKDGFVVKAGWPLAASPDLTLRSANKYLQDSIVLMRKLLQKQIFGSKKANKGAPVTLQTEEKLRGLIYVNEQYDGWKAECLRILQNKYNRKTRSFALDSEIMDALKQSSVGQARDFKKIQKLCMPFLKFKKD